MLVNVSISLSSKWTFWTPLLVVNSRQMCCCPLQEVAAKYGVLKKDLGVALRGLFVINPGGSSRCSLHTTDASAISWQLHRHSKHRCSFFGLASVLRVSSLCCTLLYTQCFPTPPCSLRINQWELRKKSTSGMHNRSIVPANGLLLQQRLQRLAFKLAILVPSATPRPCEWRLQHQWPLPADGVIEHITINNLGIGR